jgi:hypothetical protein
MADKKPIEVTPAMADAIARLKEMGEEDPLYDEGVRKKRTVRAQLTNGALEAKAYVEPTGLPVEAPHKTFEMQTVDVDESLDPRKRATVARGMGEQVEMMEGDIVDPATGQVLPPVGADPRPLSPWNGGKRPTRQKMSPAIARPAPDARAIATSPASRPPVVAWAAAAFIVVAAVAGALVIAQRAGGPPPIPSGVPARATETPAPPAAEGSPRTAPTAAVADDTPHPLDAPAPASASSAPATPSPVTRPGSAPRAPDAPPTPAPGESAKKGRGGRIF